MAKRRQKNIELERQLSKRKMIFRVVSMVVAVAIVLAVGIGIWTVQDGRWIMRYDGGRVATTDFRTVFYLGFQNDPMAREVALESTQSIIALRDRAIYHNVDFTPEERANFEFDAEMMRNQLIMNQGFDSIPFVSNARLAELFYTEPLSERLKDIYFPTYNVDEDEIAPLLEEYLEEMLYRHLDLQVYILILDDLEEMEEAYSMIGTVDFEDIMRQFSPGMDEDSEVEAESAVEFSDWITDPEDREHLLGLEAGEYSRIIEWHEDGITLYFLFHAISREDPDPDAAAEDFRERFINERRDESFFDLVMEWVEEANFVVNRRGYNTV